MKPVSSLLFSQICQWILPWASQLAHTHFCKIHLILSSYLSLGLQSSLFLSGFISKILFAFLISPCMLHVSLIFLDSVTLIIFGEVQCNVSTEHFCKWNLQMDGLFKEECSYLYSPEPLIWILRPWYSRIIYGTSLSDIQCKCITLYSVRAQYFLLLEWGR
jgi:hypothetical protein